MLTALVRRFAGFGKALWRTSTFGLTDMGRFYSEKKAPRVFRLMGLMIVVMSIPSIVIGIASFSGPGKFAAMRESRGTLKEAYGKADSWTLSARSAPSSNDDFFVEYTYGSNSGMLHARWSDDHYVFSEDEED